MIFNNLDLKYYNRGLELAKENQITEAIEVLKKSIGLNPKNEDSWNVLGLCFYRLGEFAFAKDVWEKSLKINSNSSENQAFQYIEEMKQQEFITFCEKYNKAVVLAQKGQLKEAVDLLSQEEMKKYEVLKYKNLLALCKFGQNEKMQALEIWKSALRIDSGNKETIQYLQADWGNLKETSIVLQWMKKWFTR